MKLKSQPPMNPWPRPRPTPMLSLDSKQSMYVAPLTLQADRNLNRLIFTGCSTNTKWFSVIPKLQTDRQAERQKGIRQQQWQRLEGVTDTNNALWVDFTALCVHRETSTESTCGRRRVSTSNCWAAERAPGISPGDQTYLETHSNR